ncbi:MAG: MFS transporter [Chlamydiales bacterium]|nr:MFS transporter [Chlamydiales bacterium]
MSDKTNKRLLFTLFSVVFLELLAYCMVMPSFYPIFLDDKFGLIRANHDIFYRKALYGSLMMCYPLAQVIGAPLMGMLSDRVGRKKAFSITLLSNISGYTLAAFALIFQRIELIFIGFSFSGLTGGNISISQSAVADISPNQSKAKNMSIVFASYGVCYIIGSLFGGHLSYTSFANLSPYAIPFFCAACVSALNLCFVLYYFKETFLLKATRSFKKPALKLKDIIDQLRKSHNIKLILIIFLSFFGWNFFMKVMQVFLNDQYNFLAKENAYALAYFGLCTIITQAFLIPFLSKRYSSSQFIKASTLTLGLSLFAMPFTNSLKLFYLAFTFAAISYSFILPNVTAVMSNLNSSDAQGKVMGISQSIQSFAKTIAPLPAALLSAYDIALPLFASGAALLLTWFLFTFVFRLRKIPVLNT